MQQTLRTSAAVRGVDLAAILVRDPAAEIAFYRDVLGMIPTEIDEQARGAEFTLADGSTFGVWNTGDGSAPASGNVIFFAVDDVPAAVASVRQRGGTVSDPMESPVCTMAFGNDPDGNGFALHRRNERHDDPPQRAAADPADVVGIDIMGCFTDDVERSIAFYRDVLGIAPTKINEQGRGAEFTLADGYTFGIWKPEGTPGTGGMFAVGDAHAAVARIRARGGTVADPFETPVCFMAFGTDPEGNGFIIHQRKVRD